MAQKPAFLVALEERDPEFASLLVEARNDTHADGALQAKTKLLIAMALDAAADHARGAGALADAAREAGATEDEVTEAMEVVASMCGLQGLAGGVQALE